jgi:hypothetical protein
VRGAAHSSSSVDLPVVPDKDMVEYQEKIQITALLQELAHQKNCSVFVSPLAYARRQRGDRLF